jgi:hypothetical protein
MPDLSDSKTLVAMGQPPSGLFWNRLPGVTISSDADIPPALAPLVYAKLGETAWQRFANFSQWPDGWSGPHSRAVSWITYRNFEKFLSQARFATSRPPSLFLTDAGHIELAWEAHDGSTIHITFTQDGADYFIESSAEESSVAENELEALASRCTKLSLCN